MTLALLITAATGAWAQATTPEPGTVTINEDKSEASFTMPASDVTATYTIKRDMTVDVTATIDDRIRIKKDGNDYQPVGKEGNIDASAALPAVTDNLDSKEPVTMTEGTDKDYTLTLQKQGDTEDDWTDVTEYSVGNFRYKITGTGNYSGIAYSNTFELFEGYEVEVPAGEYITYYKDEALKVEDENAKLYTITAVSGTTATADELTIAPANTPILVKNNGSETKTILLIPTTEETDASINVYDGFKGTLEAKTTTNTDTYGPWNMAEGKKYYAFNGLQFVWVKDALDIAANKAWLEVSATASAAPQIRLVFNSATGIERVDGGQLTVDSWYSLDGRRLPGKPSQKGVYIVNGKKVVIK